MTIRTARCSLWIAAIALVGFGTACDRKTEPPQPSGPRPLMSVSPFGSEVFPLANGDAYLINQHDEQLFYLSKGVAVRVQGVDLRGLDPTIYPVANGAAYLASADDSRLRLYYLVADHALEVKETAHRPTQSMDGPSREGFFWAQAQAANLTYRRYKRRIEDAQPADPPERDN